MKSQLHKYYFKLLLIFLFLLKESYAFSQKDSLITGKEIFQTHCGSCHHVHREIIGPALASITKKRSIDWLIPFIKNSQRVIASDDEYANTLAEQYNHMVMPSFKLSNQEINRLLHYIERESIVADKECGKIKETNYHINYPNTDILHGRDLFINQCSSCHSIVEEKYGPALASVSRRRPKVWLIHFIKNSQQVIKKGDPYSASLFKGFKNKVMVPMEFLSDDDISDILKYIEYTSGYQIQQDQIGNGNISKAGKTDNRYVESKSGTLVFKVFFILLILIGLTIQSVLLSKLYQYLKKENGMV